MAFKALGVVATGLTVLIVAVAKFTEGAWITLVLKALLTFAGQRRTAVVNVPWYLEA